MDFLCVLKKHQVNQMCVMEVPELAVLHVIVHIFSVIRLNAVPLSGTVKAVQYV